MWFQRNIHSIKGGVGAACPEDRAQAASVRAQVEPAPSVSCPETRGLGWEGVAGAPRDGAMARLVINLPPPQATYEVSVYKSGETKPVLQCYTTPILEVLPGSYDVELTGRRIGKVAVARGCETRLHAGLLNITLSSEWSIHDADKKRLMVGYSKTTRGRARRQVLDADRARIRPG